MVTRYDLIDTATQFVRAADERIPLAASREEHELIVTARCFALDIVQNAARVERGRDVPDYDSEPF